MITRTMRYLKGNLFGRILLLSYLSMLPGLLLSIYAIIRNQHDEVEVILLSVISPIVVSWLGGMLLIGSNMYALSELASRIAAGDLAARAKLGKSFAPLEELAEAVGQLAVSLEQRTAQSEKSAYQVTSISEMVSEFAIQQDLSTVLQSALDKIQALLGVSQTGIALYQPQTGDLEIVVVNGFQRPVGTRVRIGESLIGRAAPTRWLEMVGNTHLWTEKVFKSEDKPISTEIQAPMLYRGELIGVLSVAQPEAAWTFHQPEMALINLFAGMAASAIKNVRLFEETHRRLMSLEAINAVSTALRAAHTIDEMMPQLLDKLLMMFNAALGSIWLYDQRENQLWQIVMKGLSNGEVHQRPGEGIVGKVFSTAQSYFTLDWKEDPLTSNVLRPYIPTQISAAFIPIRTAQAVVGVLVVGLAAPRKFSDDQIRLITTLAEMAGSAIHRTQLYEQTKSRLQRLNALHQIDIAITGSLDLGNTLQILLDQVINQLGVDAACALVSNPSEQTLEFAASRGFASDALRYTRLHFGEGYAGRAALEQRIIYIADLLNRHTDFLRSPSFGAEGFVSYYAVPLKARNQVKGVLELFHRAPLERDLEWMDFLEALASQAAIAIDNAALFNELQHSNNELNLAYQATLEGWSRALDLRDRETEGHSKRVTEITIQLARAVGVEERELVHIRRGALLHDIGKLGIPDRILLKPGPLNEEEREIIEKHPIIAFEMLSPIQFLRLALDIPYCHHEKWNGTGYPRGLKGEAIPLSARIFAVADVWDALRSDRPYRKGWSEASARDYLMEQAGHHFDPRIVTAYLALLNDEKI